MKNSLFFVFFLSTHVLLAQNQASDCATGNVLCTMNSFQQPPILGAGFNVKEADNEACFNTGFPATNVEMNSVWYKWTCETSGSFTFIIEPSKIEDDIDFVVYELPNGVDNCTNKKAIRCMAAGDNGFPSLCMGPTGLKEGETEEIGYAGCTTNNDNFLKPLALEKGKTYALMVNNFTSTGNTFSISFGGTATLKTNPNCFMVASEELNTAAATFSITPNPSSTEFVLHYPISGEEQPIIHLNSANGQRVMSNLSLDTTIDLPSNVANGLYFVTIQTADVFVVKKVILQKNN